MFFKTIAVVYSFSLPYRIPLNAQCIYPFYCGLTFVLFSVWNDHSVAVNSHTCLLGPRVQQFL